MKNKDQTLLKIEQAIEQLRPFMHADGGDIEFVELTDTGVVKVKLLGSCSDCSMSHMTLRAGLEEALKVAAPEVSKVEAIEL
jgi:Fe-S cluster biogenesis protein NfuA